MTEAEVSQFTSMRLDALRPSPDNPRKHFDAAGLEQLAANIKEHGVISPLVVRKVYEGQSDEHFEIVSGERRYRASKAAGLKEVPVRVLQLSDAAALEIQVIENLQRSDIHELEEADGYRLLQERHGYTVADLAEKVGKSTGYIYGRLKLCSLIDPSAREAFFSRTIAPSVAVFIARLPEQLQAEATREVLEGDGRWEHGNEKRFAMGTRDALEFLEKEYSLRLNDAVFPLDSALLLPAAGPCTTCPKRTGNQPSLFAIETPDVCTDRLCFQAKTKRHHVVTIDFAREAGRTVIEGQAAKKLFPYAGMDTPEGGYVRLDTRDREWDNREGKYVYQAPLRERLGAACPPATVVVHPTSGDAIEVITTAEFKAAAKKAGIKVAGGSEGTRKSESRGEDSEAAVREKAQRAKEEAKRKERVARSYDVAAALIGKVSEVIKTEPLTSGCLSDALRFALAGHPYARKTLSSLGMLPEKTDPYSHSQVYDRIVAKAVETLGAREIAALLVRASLVDQMSGDVPGVDRHHGEYTSELKALAGMFADKVSLRDLEKEATDRRIRAAEVAAQGAKADAAIAAATPAPAPAKKKAGTAMAEAMTKALAKPVAPVKPPKAAKSAAAEKPSKKKPSKK